MERHWLGILLQPKALIPIALAVALLVFALSLGNLPLAAAKIGKITLSVVFKVRPVPSFSTLN